MLEGVAQQIEQLINSIGRDVLIRTYTVSGSAHRPTKTPVNPDVTAKATITEYKNKDVDGTVIQANDRMLRVSGSTVITKQNTIIDDGIEYRIEKLRPVQPGSERFLYIGQLRSSASGG